MFSFVCLLGQTTPWDPAWPRTCSNLPACFYTAAPNFTSPRLLPILTFLAIITQNTSIPAFPNQIIYCLLGAEGHFQWYPFMFLWLCVCFCQLPSGPQWWSGGNIYTVSLHGFRGTLLSTGIVKTRQRTSCSFQQVKRNLLLAGSWVWNGTFSDNHPS